VKKRGDDIWEDGAQRVEEETRRPKRPRRQKEAKTEEDQD
jgi:hypothetical protein